ncbi:5'/3'-nucleotidase sure family protein [Apiospora saccharicola]|uniref:5'/3'-nucleotidase sure family protein n=1 Tax=Apiospora saccharicola TaxID=335842 RepID=A0ABR1VN41_9PEZI
MRVQVITALSALAASAQGVRILQSNDDGWAELYIRSLHQSLRGAGHDVVLSSPAENKSGSSSRDAEPEPRKEPCMYDSCAANSGPVGTNASDPRLNWVNSFPVTALKYGLSTFGPQQWNGAAPELVVSGPNVGTNLWVQVPFSGTVGIAVHAAHEAKVPALAFSGASSGTLRWDTDPVPQRSAIYAALATKLTDAVVASGAPYLPEDVWLNVNMPKVEGDCTNPAKFVWVLSRLNPGWFSQKDVDHCGSTRLPTETDVLLSGGCRIAVSIGDANDKTTAPADKQTIVRDKLKSMLTCMP